MSKTTTRVLPLAALALLVALAAGLVLALRHGPGVERVRLLGRPVVVRETLAPRDPQFGDTVVATIDVFADASRVDPQSLRVTTGFAPYRVASSTRSVRTVSGVTVMHLEHRLRCLAAACVPPGDSRTLRFAPVRVSYRAGSLTRPWPALTVHSRVAKADLRHPILHVPPPEPAASDYRLPPRPTAYTLFAIAGLLAAGGAALLLIVALRHVELGRRRESSLEQILDELGAASANGDSGRRRRALEELARQLERLDEPLSVETRVLAWGPGDPQPDAVSELASRVRAAVS